MLVNERICYLLDSSVSIVTGKVLDDQKLITIRKRILFLCHYFQARAGIHSVSYPEGRPVNHSGRKVHHSLSSDAKVKNEWNCDSLLQYNLIEWCLSEHIHSTEGEHIHRRQEHKWKDSVNQRLFHSVVGMSVAQAMLKVALLPKQHIFISIFLFI